MVARQATDPDRTLSAPDLRHTLAALDTPVATIAWHPDRARIGEQAAVLPARDGTWTLDRYAPLFYRAGAGGDGDGAPLAHRGVSRQPLRVRVIEGGGLAIAAESSRMACVLDGQPLEGEVAVAASALQAGVFLRLGERVLLVLHAQGAVPRGGSDFGLVGVSSAIARVREQVRQVARSTLPVLVLGESGTGKELVARAIHAHSRRHAGPLVCVNMAALSETLAAAELFGAVRGAYTGAQQTRRGLFAEAHDGTLFLDEIGDTPAAVQPMLLRTLESGEYRALGAARNERADVRLVAATDRDLGAGFNQPLLRRLEAFTMRMPPLRTRREDIGVLIAHFLELHAAPESTPVELDAATVEALATADWPGNVRQLSHAVRRLALAPPDELAVTLAEVLQPSPIATPRDGARDAPKPLAEPASTPTTPRAARTRHRDPATFGDDDVFDALAATGWCVRDAALHLGISRTSFYALLERSRRVRRIDDIPLAEIRAALAAAPADPSRWAALLCTPRESLRRRIRSLGLLPR